MQFLIQSIFNNLLTNDSFQTQKPHKIKQKFKNINRIEQKYLTLATLSLEI